MLTGHSAQSTVLDPDITQSAGAAPFIPGGPVAEQHRLLEEHFAGFAAPHGGVVVVSPADHFVEQLSRAMGPLAMLTGYAAIGWYFWA